MSDFIIVYILFLPSVFSFLNIIIAKKRCKANPNTKYGNKPIFFDFSFVKIMRIIGFFSLLAAVASAFFVGQTPKHSLLYITAFLEIESFFLFLYVIYHFIISGKNFKRMTGKFTWKPPEGY